MQLYSSQFVVCVNQSHQLAYSGWALIFRPQKEIKAKLGPDHQVVTLCGVLLSMM